MVVKQTHVVVEKISLNVQVFAHIVTQHNVKISKLLPTSKKTKTNDAFEKLLDLNMEEEEQENEEDNNPTKRRKVL